MSDLKDSTVTYTEVSSLFKDLSIIGSLGVVVYGYDGLPMHPPSTDYVPEPAYPPSPDYMPGPKHPSLPIYVPYVSEPAYPESMPPEDDVLPAEEQPLPTAVSSTADSPGYITESSPEEDLEDNDEDLEEDPANYATDRDDDKEEDEESFGDDADDEDEDEEELRYHLKRGFALLSNPDLRWECSSAPTARPIGGFTAYYGFVGTLDAEIRRDLDREIGYGITNVREDPNDIAEEIPTIDVAELSQRMTDFITTVRQDTDEIYGKLDDAEDDRLLMSGQLNSLRKDRRSHARTARLMESKARASREAWAQSMDASDMVRSEVRALQTTVLTQLTEIR
nr:hypothetical protein [Tanacetum cinerariifolium]